MLITMSLMVLWVLCASLCTKEVLCGVYRDPTFLPVPVKGLYQTESHSLHVMRLVRIYVHAIVCLVTLKIGKTNPKKLTSCQIFILILFYFSTISYLDCWEKINYLFTDGNREKIISSRPFIFVTLGMYG